jgi:hypothetical protein
VPVTVTVTSGPVTSGPRGHGRGGQVRGQLDFGPPLTRPRPLPSPAPNLAAEAPKCVEVVKSEVCDLRSVTVTSDLTTSTHFGASSAGFGAGLGSGRGRVRGGIQAHTSEEPRKQKEQAVMTAQEVAERQSPFCAPEEEEEEEEGGGGYPRLFKAKVGADAKGVAEEGEGKGDWEGKRGSSTEPEVTGARCRAGGMARSARSANTDADASVPELEDRPVKTTAAHPPLLLPLPPPDTRHGQPGRDKSQEEPGGGGREFRVTPRNSWHFFEEDYERKMVVDELVARRQMALYFRRGWEHDKRVLRMTVPLKRGSASKILARPGGGAVTKIS